MASAEEVEPLVDGGADELFCGLFPTGWYERWGRGSWPNRRGPGPANIESVEDLVRLADAAHGEGPLRPGGRRASLFVALNQQYYPDDQADFLLGLAREVLERAAIDAFIVSDPGFMSALKEALPEARIFASTVTVALNADSVRFLQDLGDALVVLRLLLCRLQGSSQV